LQCGATKTEPPFKKTHYPSADQIANNDIENPLHPVATHCNAALQKRKPFQKTHYRSADQIANNDIEKPLHPVATHCNATLQKRSPPSKKRIIHLPTKSPTTILKTLFTP
jgi:hypothetical protein